MKLYPLKFTPIHKPKIWGGEQWLISAYGEDVSVVENGYLAENDLNELVEVYMGELVGDHVYEQYGNQFPLLIKTIDAQEKLSIQVHPNDEVAWERHSSLGKEEMWYVMDARHDSSLILGLNKDANREQLSAALQNGSLPDWMNVVKVKEGDVAHLPSGLIHALNAHVKVAEIQETSDLTYRLHDYNRPGLDGKPRELHIDYALDVIDYKQHEKPLVNYSPKQNGAVNLVENLHFVTNLICFNKTIERDYMPLDSFVVYICVKGSFSLVSDEEGDMTTILMQEGEAVLLPASTEQVKLSPTTKEAKLLEVYAP